MQSLTNSSSATTTTPPASPVLSGPLTSWLLGEPSDHKAVEVITKSAILKAEARDALPALRAAALTPATEDQIKATISQRFALFPQPQRNDAEWAAWWADYFDALSGLTAPAVEAGMAAWVKSPDAEWLCKPGKLRELAMTTPNNNRWARAARIAIAATIEPIRDYEKPKTPAMEKQDAETVAALMKDFHAQMKAKAPPPVSRTRSIPPPCAPVDETGISAEMRDLLDRQNPNRQAAA